MEKVKSPMIQFISRATIAGNIVFVLWISYNGINEGFQGTMVEKVSFVTLICLLTVNTILILRKRK